MPSPTTRGCAGSSRRALGTARIPPSAAFAVVAAFALLGVAAGCGKGDTGSAPKGPPPPSVEVITLVAEPFEQQVDLVGEVQADNTAVVKSEVPGVIESVEFQDGQTVKAGDVLFRLRDREQAARLRESEAELALAQEDFERTNTLANRNAAAAAQLDKARANLEVARARAELRRVELDRTRIRAPFDGRVGARLVSPGARIKVEDGLVRVDGIDPLSLVFTIPEATLPLAHLGARYELEVAAFPDRHFPGEIRFIAPSVDSATRRILIKGRVPNPDGALLPGMFARVKAKLGERNSVLVPDEALVTTNDGTFVWRIGAEDKAERVAVELGGREAGRVEIVSGVAAGDRIVTAGTHKVHAGATVKPVTVAAPDAPPPSPSAAAAPGGDA
jgi:membrane fusion protein (multidrug efflux system)